MRSNIPFDTHAFVKKLVAAGLPEAQAEVHAEALGELVIERLATKDDVQSVKEDIGRLRDELHALEERLESRMDARLKDLELRMTVRFGGMMAVAVAVIAVLIKVL